METNHPLIHEVIQLPDNINIDTLIGKLGSSKEATKQNLAPESVHIQHNSMTCPSAHQFRQTVDRILQANWLRLSELCVIS